MPRFTCSLALSSLLALTSCQSRAIDGTTVSAVSDTDIVQFIVDRNRFLTDRDLDAILKYYPDNGVIVANRTEGDNAKELIQTREEVAVQTRKFWKQYDPSEFSSGLALESVTRQSGKVILQFSYVEVVPDSNRHILVKGSLQFTLAKIKGQTKMVRKELLSANSKWVDMEIPETESAPDSNQG